MPQVISANRGGEWFQGFLQGFHPDTSDVSIIRRCFLFFLFIFSGGAMSRGGGLGSLARFGGRGRGGGGGRPGTHLIILLDHPHFSFGHCFPCPSMFLLGAL